MDPSLLERAVAHLARGELLGLPTETVYGLACDARNDDAVRRVFALKGRPANHPVIVHLHDPRQLDDWAATVPCVARTLADAFWPGPLTLILPRHPSVSDCVTGGHPTVGLRIPAHPVARALLQAFGESHSGALAAPSANRFGRVSPTRAQHVRAEFGEALAMVLDGGASEVGIESTIVDCSGGAARVLRPGQISEDDLVVRIGTLATKDGAPSKTAAPGTLASHYAVRVPTYCEQDPSACVVPSGRWGWIGFQPPVLDPSGGQIKLLGDTPEAFAQGLYAALRELETQGVDVILIQALPKTSAWQGIVDRVQRACVPPIH